jgi:hypothetical protein
MSYSACKIGPHATYWFHCDALLDPFTTRCLCAQRLACQLAPHHPVVRLAVQPVAKRGVGRAGVGAANSRRRREPADHADPPAERRKRPVQRVAQHRDLDVRRTTGGRPTDAQLKIRPPVQWLPPSAIAHKSVSTSLPPDLSTFHYPSLAVFDRISGLLSISLHLSMESALVAVAVHPPALASIPAGFYLPASVYVVSL